MNKVIAVILLVVLHLVMNLFLPWWNIVVVSMLTVWLTRLQSISSWLIPAFTLSLLWGIWIMILDQKTGFHISSRVGALFNAKGFISYVIPIVGCFIISGLSGLTAYLIKSSFGKESIESMTVDDYKMTQPDMGDKEII